MLLILLSSLLKLCFCVILQVAARFLHLCHSLSLPLGSFPPLSTTSELRELYQLTAGGKRVMPSAEGLNENMCKSLPQTHTEKVRERDAQSKKEREKLKHSQFNYTLHIGNITRRTQQSGKQYFLVF